VLLAGPFSTKESSLPSLRSLCIHGGRAHVRKKCPLVPFPPPPVFLYALGRSASGRPLSDEVPSFSLSFALMCLSEHGLSRPHSATTHTRIARACAQTLFSAFPMRALNGLAKEEAVGEAGGGAFLPFSFLPFPLFSSSWSLRRAKRRGGREGAYATTDIFPRALPASTYFRRPLATAAAEAKEGKGARPARAGGSE